MNHLASATRADQPLMQASPPVFALLDDCDATAEQPTSRLYTQWHSSVVCTDPADLDAWQGRVQQALTRGLHAVLLADYEWGAQLQGVPLGELHAGLLQGQQESDRAPACLRVELFHTMERLDQDAVNAWLEAQMQALPWPNAGVLAWQPQVNQAQFTDAIAQVHAAIERGDTYQINYTFGYQGHSYGHPLALYCMLRARQPAQYGALIGLPARAGQQAWVLSFSPELFLRVEAGRMTARPMKGTAPVQATEAQTEAMATWLHNDPKNRAENVMIVDLLRNDVGVVAQTGTVHVQDLFAVQRNGRVLGMTSTVQALLRDEVGLAEVLRATFPCGSITGAPKRKTMGLIAQIERGWDAKQQPHPHRRGVYTGAIGWVEPTMAPHKPHAEMHERITLDPQPPALAMNYCLSVPIRTLLLDMPVGSPDLHGAADDVATTAVAAWHPVRLSVGAGIVWDSRAEQEWQECQLKASFALQGAAGFELFETMRVVAGRALPEHWERHVERLTTSAQALGFMHRAQEWSALVQHHIQQQLFSQGEVAAWRVRMALNSEGVLSITHGPLAALATAPDGTVGLLLADHVCRTPAWLRQHKTTLRTDYDAAMKAAEAVGAFDCMFFNEEGYLTEGARSNVLLKPDADLHAPWWTPPVADGVLPGVMRSALLASPDWTVQERRLTRDDLLNAHEIVVCNALRGALRGRLWL